MGILWGFSMGIFYGDFMVLWDVWSIVGFSMGYIRGPT
jgi:hypothetical protein